MKTKHAAIERLTACGVRPSVQRIALMEYLLTHPTHPSVDEVWRNVVKEIPTLSRTTVYNTLRMLADNGAARMITVDDHHVLYDGDTAAHGHFYCRNCGRVTDVPAPLTTADIHPSLSQMQIDEVHCYYKGLCPDCQADS